MFTMKEEERLLISSRIKEIREDNGLTITQLGEIMGVSRPTASRYESGDVENIPLPRIKDLALRFGVNPAWILGWSDKKLLYGKDE